MRKNISSGTPSEKRVGYSRAIVIGNRMYFSGTTSIDENGRTIGNNVYEQSEFCFKKIKEILESESFSLNDVVQVTAFLTDMNGLRDFDKAFTEYFFEIKPCCTVLGVKELVKSDLLVEIGCVVERSN